MLKGLEGDCREKEEEGETRWRDQHERRHRGVKPMGPGRMAVSSFNCRKGLGRSKEGVLGNNARLQMG